MATKKTETKSTSKRRTISKEVSVKASDWLSFSSAIIIVAVAAIFYFAGWVYVSHWYGYFGIDATQINLSLQLILIHGIPGILILIIAGLLAIVGTEFYKSLTKKSKRNGLDFPIIVVAAYGLAIFPLTLLLIFSIEKNGNKAPPEAILSLLLIVFCVLVYIAIDIIFTILAFFSGKTIYLGEFNIPVVMPRFLAWTVALSIIMRDALKKRDLVRIKKIYKFPPDPEILQEIADKQKYFMEYAKSRSVDVTKTISRTQRFWIGALLFFYFLISISTSSILGEWDAARGSRLMVGDWHIPEISLYSTSAIPALGKFESKLNSGYEYKHLGLLSSDDKVYYLVDWKTTEYYQQQPKVYIVPRNDNLILNFIVSPFVYPTATPLQLPTKTITPTLTPIPTVIFTITPTP